MKRFFVAVLLAMVLTGVAAAQDVALPAPPAPPEDVQTVPAPAAPEAPVPPLPPVPEVPMFLSQATPPTPPTPPAPPTPPTPPSPFGMNWYAPGKGSYLGIGVQELDEDRAKELKLAEPHGVEITMVHEDSPAFKAGIKEGDVVIEFNGQRVEGVEQFVRLVRETPPGRTVKLLINRNGANQMVTATVANRKAFMPQMDPKFAEEMRKMGEEMARKGEEMRRQFGDGSQFQKDMQRDFGPDSQFQKDMQKLREDMKNMHWDFEWQGPDSMEGHGRATPRLGVESEPIGSQLSEFFGVKQGVLVRSVVEGSAAAKAGIKAGDVIVKIGATEVDSPRDITSALRASEAGKAVPVTLVRNKQAMTLNVTPTSRPARHPRPGPAPVPHHEPGSGD